ncbi:hypothetical protein KO527_16290 [Pseudoalteromonas sp. C2R02]|uniref:hypothetical protein n=1 Tax=Pseudoalteromonas sp. C2R02 TaxID=2841565 RepID=UPI001C09CB0E|nr:hypothetical protein [Pseudoalteromonas sp. C2R02]MBU2970912.1 hypothetical protein [Pseudoalteromonas sp. C2R02]
MQSKEVQYNVNCIVKKFILIISLALPSSVFASDPSALYWPFIIGLAVLGLLLFIVSCILITCLVNHRYLKTILIGFFFGIFLGPVHLPNGSFIMNIANLFFGDGQDSLFLAIIYASGYAIIFFIIYFSVNNRSQKKPK